MTYTKSKMGITSEGFSRIAKGLGIEPEKAPAKKRAQEVDETSARELVLWIDNTGSLYPQKQAIYKNLIKKIQQGVYDSQLAAQAFSYLVEAGAKDYFRNFGSSGMKWSDMFSKATRQAAAEEMVNDFETSDEVNELSGPEPTNDIEARIKSAINKSKKAAKDSPRVYVGTYNKYNRGSIKGAWLDLDDYSDYEEFMQAALKLHSDESDPELMFQDWEGIPDWAISESHLDPAYFEVKDELGNIDEEAFNIFVDHYYGRGGMKDIQEAIENFQESFQGEFRDMTAFAENLVEDIGIDSIANKEFYFDSEKFARDLGYDGYEWVSASEAEENPDEYPDGEGVYANGDYMGDYRDLEQMVDDWISEGMIGESSFDQYFDYEKFGRDLEMGGDFWEEDGYVFRRI